jgi:hypothetical protein
VDWLCRTTTEGCDPIWSAQQATGEV